jgi:O-antigen/teichoic acid export membrane protein
VDGLVSLALRLVLTGAIALAVFASMQAQAIMDLRYSEHTGESAPAFAVLMWCFVAVCTTYVFGTLLTAGGSLKRLNMMAAAGAVLNIGLNLVLIPHWHAEGAAWASLATQAATALVQVVLALQAFRLKLPWQLLLRVTVFGAGAFAIVLAGGHFKASLPVLFAVYAPAVAILAFATGLLRRSDLAGLPLPNTDRLR